METVGKKTLQKVEAVSEHARLGVLIVTLTCTPAGLNKPSTRLHPKTCKENNEWNSREARMPAIKKHNRRSKITKRTYEGKPLGRPR